MHACLDSCMHAIGVVSRSETSGIIFQIHERAQSINLWLTSFFVKYEWNVTNIEKKDGRNQCFLSAFLGELVGLNLP